MNKSIALLVLSSTVFLHACGDESGVFTEPSGVTFNKSSVERERAPVVSDQQFADFTKDNSQFAWDIYQQMSKKAEEGNVFFSPYSISMALAMTYAGAQGETKTEMAQALNFNLADAPLHAGFNKLSAILESRNLAKTDKFEALTINTNNALWPALNRVPDITPEFLDVLAKNYGAGVYALDYARDPEACRVEINRAVYDWTNTLIENIIPKDKLSPSTSFVITNTIYMKSPWETPFVAWSTEEKPFNNHDGRISKVNMMHSSIFTQKSMRYWRDNDVQALAIPYRGGDLEMIVFLPDLGHFDSFEKNIDQNKINIFIQGLKSTDGVVDLKLPKFSIEFDTSLTGAMDALGMKLAFVDGLADFGLLGKNLVIEDILHKSFIDVTEAGTESAAATAVIGSSGAAASVEVEFNVDRPFIFIIHDRPTGNILFVGRVLSLEN